MAKKAASVFIKYQLDVDIGDKVFCLVDLEQFKYAPERQNGEKMFTLSKLT